MCLCLRLLAQMAKASGWHPPSRGFEPRRGRISRPGGQKTPLVVLPRFLGWLVRHSGRVLRPSRAVPPGGWSDARGRWSGPVRRCRQAQDRKEPGFGGFLGRGQTGLFLIKMPRGRSFPRPVRVLNIAPKKRKEMLRNIFSLTNWARPNGLPDRHA